MKAAQENHLESHTEGGVVPGTPPLFLRQLSPEMRALLERHFWCDFSDIIPSMAWDNVTRKKQ